MYEKNIPILDDESSDFEYKEEIKKFPNYDSTYIFNGLVKYRRDCIEKAYEISSRFLDENFKEQIKIQGNFHSRLWELQLCSILISKGYKLIIPPKIKKQLARPDFCIILDNGSKIWIEAVCPQLGRLDKKPEIIPGQIYTRSSNIKDELHLSAPRIISSTLAKFQKLDLYKNNPDFGTNDKFIIAINTELIDHHEPANMAKELVLYGMGLQYIKQTGESGRYFHEEITIDNDNKKVTVPTALFHKKDYSHISAVMSSNCWFDFGGNFIEDMAQRVNTYINHNGTNPLNHETINFGTRHEMVCNGEHCTLKHHSST